MSTFAQIAERVDRKQRLSIDDIQDLRYLTAAAEVRMINQEDEDEVLEQVSGYEEEKIRLREVEVTRHMLAMDKYLFDKKEELEQWEGRLRQQQRDWNELCINRMEDIPDWDHEWDSREEEMTHEDEAVAADALWEQRDRAEHVGKKVKAVEDLAASHAYLTKQLHNCVMSKAELVSTIHKVVGAVAGVNDQLKVAFMELRDVEPHHPLVVGPLPKEEKTPLMRRKTNTKKSTPVKTTGKK